MTKPYEMVWLLIIASTLAMFGAVFDSSAPDLWRWIVIILICVCLGAMFRGVFSNDR